MSGLGTWHILLVGRVVLACRRRCAWSVRLHGIRARIIAVLPFLPLMRSHAEHACALAPCACVRCVFGLVGVSTYMHLSACCTHASGPAAFPRSHRSCIPTYGNANQPTPQVLPALSTSEPTSGPARQQPLAWGSCNAWGAAAACTPPGDPHQGREVDTCKPWASTLCANHQPCGQPAAVAAVAAVTAGSSSRWQQ